MDPQLIAEKLVKFQIFKDLQAHPGALERLSTLVQPQVFQGRETIIDETKQDTRVYFLVDGQVVINKIDENGKIIVVGRADHRTHPCFGESALLGKTRRTANVAAYSQCETLSLSAENFEIFVREHPLVAASIYRSMAALLFDRLAKTTRDLIIAEHE